MSNDLTDFQARACAAGIIKMLGGTSFSICDLDTIAKAIGKERRMAGRDYEALRTLHCVAWADMGPELTRMVQEKCFELLELPQAAIEGVFNKTDTPSKVRLTFWK